VSLFPVSMIEKAAAILAACKEQGKTIATAESCTGGLLSAILTELPGSSRMFTHGFITYANEAKIGLVGVDSTLIAQHGAVSEAVARAMAEGALKCSGADVSMAITGVAGPGGGSPSKPVGTVHVACAMKGVATVHQHQIFTGERSAIRMAAADCALGIIIAELAR